MSEQTIHAAGELFPAWLSWILPLYFLATLGLAYFAARVTLRIALRPLWKYDGEAWHERARLAFPRLSVHLLNLVILGTVFVSFAWVFLGRGLFFPRTDLALFLLAAGIAAAVAQAGVLEESRIRKGQRLREIYRDLLVNLFLFAPMLLILGALTVLSPEQVDLISLLPAVGGVLAVDFFSRGGSLRILRVFGLLRPAPPRLLTIVEEASRRTGVECRAAFEVRWSQANAIAFPVTKEVLFTSGALSALDDDELIAIAVHEFAHLGESKWTIFLRRIQPLSLVPLFFWRPVEGAYDTLGVLALVMGVVVLRALTTRFMRRLEERADQWGSSHESDPGVYASALERLYATNLFPAALSQKSVHPDLYDRLVRSGVQPSYPRPAPPSGKPGLYAAAFLLVFSIGLEISVTTGAALVIPRLDETSEPSLITGVALTGGSPRSLSRLAHFYSRRNEPERAVPLHRYVLELREEHPADDSSSVVEAMRDLAAALASSGRVAEARTLYTRADELDEKHRTD